MNMVVYQYYTLKMRKRKGENLQISSTMVFFPLYFIMDSGYTNEVSVYKLYLLGVNLSDVYKRQLLCRMTIFVLALSAVLW